MTDEEDVAIARVTMQWPQTLKDRVGEVSGGRKMTQYVIEAVEAKLAGQGATDAIRKELWEVKFLCQQLADALALSGDYEDRISTLRAMELPAWIVTEGWDDEAADIVPADPEPDEAGPEEREPLARPSTAFERPPGNVYVVPDDAPIAPGEMVTISGEPKAGKSHSNDLFQRLRATAAAKGVDVDGMGLKPASTIVAPPRVEEVVAEPYSQEQVKQLDEHALEDSGLSIDDDDQADEHNHAWERMEDPHGLYTGQAYFCQCGASMDQERVYDFGETPAPKEASMEPTEAPGTAPSRCQACGDELIDGECWSCM